MSCDYFFKQIAYVWRLTYQFLFMLSITIFNQVIIGWVVLVSVSRRNDFCILRYSMEQLLSFNHHFAPVQSRLLQRQSRFSVLITEYLFQSLYWKYSGLHLHWNGYFYGSWNKVVLYLHNQNSIFEATFNGLLRILIKLLLF